MIEIKKYKTISKDHQKMHMQSNNVNMKSWRPRNKIKRIYSKSKNY